MRCIATATISVVKLIGRCLVNSLPKVELFSSVLSIINEKVKHYYE